MSVHKKSVWIIILACLIVFIFYIAFFAPFPDFKPIDKGGNIGITCLEARWGWISPKKKQRLNQKGVSLLLGLQQDIVKNKILTIKFNNHELPQALSEKILNGILKARYIKGFVFYPHVCYEPLHFTRDYYYLELLLDDNQKQDFYLYLDGIMRIFDYRESSPCFRKHIDEMRYSFHYFLNDYEEICKELRQFSVEN